MAKVGELTVRIEVDYSMLEKRRAQLLSEYARNQHNIEYLDGGDAPNIRQKAADDNTRLAPLIASYEAVRNDLRDSIEASMGDMYARLQETEGQL